MKTNEEPPKTNPRLRRIKKVIKLARFLVSASLILFLFAGSLFLADFMGLHIFPSGVKVSFSPLATFSSPFKIPTGVMVLGFLRASLFLSAGLVLFWWLDLVEAGKFFNERSVHCLKWLGWLTLVDWLVSRLLDALAHGVVFKLEELLLGFFILLIAWIMDAAREIQEEQELTV